MVLRKKERGGGEGGGQRAIKEREQLEKLHNRDRSYKWTQTCKSNERFREAVSLKSSSDRNKTTRFLVGRASK